ncbi:hypothetical protein DdX_06191 [Ditylenchus destructor]|uniref:Uncharacterized protein n=1 Tax=Ditylenchus destructor TaxID=166010 RepID=A0AAD4R9E3_9BILA|nr:hypothetical protein DdX_06191 [Ditylenchus destructor]
MALKFLLLICVFYYISNSEAVPIETSSEEPANVAECALKVTLKALNEFEAGNLSCELMHENVKEAEQCPNCTERDFLIQKLNGQINAFCQQNSSDNSTAPFPTASQSELCLLPIVTGLLQDQEQKITKSCSSLKRTLEQIRSCEDDPSKDILEDEVSKLVKWFCSKAGERQSDELSLDEE